MSLSSAAAVVCVCAYFVAAVRAWLMIATRDAVVCVGNADPMTICTA